MWVKNDTRDALFPMIGIAALLLLIVAGMSACFDRPWTRLTRASRSSGIRHRTSQR
jgi:hypothetical protein